MIRSRRRKRCALTLESLERRCVMAAPVANNDSYNLNEDGVLGTGSGTILDANLNATASPDVVLPFSSNWQFLDRIQNSLGERRSRIRRTGRRGRGTTGISIRAPRRSGRGVPPRRRWRVAGRPTRIRSSISIRPRRAYWMGSTMRPMQLTTS